MPTLSVRMARREAELSARGVNCWAQAGSHRPSKQRHRRPGLDMGHGEEGAWAALLLLARGGPIFSRWGN